MASKAARPLDPAAVRAANAGLYQRHPELLSSGRGRQLDPTSPQDAALRAEWMALYQQAGGQVEPVSPKTVAAARAQVDQQFSLAPIGSPQTPCAAAGKQTTAPPPPQPARALPPQSPGEPPCELLALKVTCGHGRSPGPERRLMVVGDNPLHPRYRGTELTMKGGCGTHPSWNHGPSPAGAGKSTSFTFKAASTAKFDSASAISWWEQAPTIHRVGAGACTGISGDLEIIAYPAGEVNLEAGMEFKFKPSEKEPGEVLKFEAELKYTYGGETFSSGFDFFKIGSIVNEGIDWIYNIFIGKKTDIKDPSDEGVQFSSKLGVKTKSAWKEDPASWAAYCETSVEFGNRPLFSASGEAPLIQGPIPPKLERWVKAGVFIKLSGEVSLTSNWKWRDWPHNGQVEVLTDEVEGAGKVTGALTGKAHLFAQDFASGSVSGETAIKLALASTRTQPPGIVFRISHDGIKVKLKGDLLWGFWQTEKEFTVMNAMENPIELYRWQFNR